jgi:hypothetical protein
LISLKSARCFRYSGKYFNYVIRYNYASGRKNRWDTMITTDTMPFMVGRELTISHSKRIIKEMEDASINYFNKLTTLDNRVDDDNYLYVPGSWGAAVYVRRIVNERRMRKVNEST